MANKQHVLFRYEIIRYIKDEILGALKSLDDRKMHHKYKYLDEQMKVLSELVREYTNLLEMFDHNPEYYSNLCVKLETEALELGQEISGLRLQKEYSDYKYGWRAFKRLLSTIYSLHKCIYSALPLRDTMQIRKNKIEGYEIVNIDITEELFKVWD